LNTNCFAQARPDGRLDGQKKVYKKNIFKKLFLYFLLPINRDRLWCKK